MSYGHQPNILWGGHEDVRVFASQIRTGYGRRVRVRKSARVKPVESAIPEIRHTRWSGQRDVRVFASQIRTGCGRLSATLPARYKRFAFA